MHHLPTIIEFKSIIIYQMNHLKSTSEMDGSSFKWHNFTITSSQLTK